MAWPNRSRGTSCKSGAESRLLVGSAESSRGAAGGPEVAGALLLREDRHGLLELARVPAVACVHVAVVHALVWACACARAYVNWTSWLPRRQRSALIAHGHMLREYGEPTDSARRTR